MLMHHPDATSISWGGTTFEPDERGDLTAGRIAAAQAGAGNDFHGPRLAGRPIDRQPHLAETAGTDSRKLNSKLLLTA